MDFIDVDSIDWGITAHGPSIMGMCSIYLKDETQDQDLKMLGISANSVKLAHRIATTKHQVGW